MNSSFDEDNVTGTSITQSVLHVTLDFKSLRTPQKKCGLEGLGEDFFASNRCIVSCS